MLMNRIFLDNWECAISGALIVSGDKELHSIIIFLANSKLSINNSEIINIMESIFSYSIYNK